MISKVTESNKALYEARLALINAALEKANSTTRITDFESYYANITEIRKICTNFTSSTPGEKIEGKFLLMPLDEPLFEIDANKRTITVPATFSKNGIGVRGDHQAETLYFAIDRYFDYQDLFGVDEIIINWRFRPANASRNIDIPINTALAFAPDDEYIPGSVVFGWVIEKDMTPSKGVLEFSIGFIKLTNGVYEYALNTQITSVNVNDSLYLEDPSILTTLKRPVYERLRDSRYTPDSLPAVSDPTWRTGEVIQNDEGEDVRQGLYSVANFDIDGTEEADTLLLQAIGDTGSQDNVNVKYDWYGTTFATGEAVRRDKDSAFVENDLVVTNDSAFGTGIYFTYDFDTHTKTPITTTAAFAEAKNNYETIYEEGSSLEVREGGSYIVEMLAVRETTLSNGEAIYSKSGIVPSTVCVVPHAAIPNVTLKVNGVNEEEGEYTIEDAEVANEYTFVMDDAPVVNAIITKNETNVKSLKGNKAVELAVNKLAVAPDDINQEASLANQDAITVYQKDNNIIIVGNLMALNKFNSTNPNQGEARWIGLDLATNVNDITTLTWNDFELTLADVAEAASVGLGDGHIIFWAKAENLPRIIKIGNGVYGSEEFKFMFVESENFVEDDYDANAELVIANSRKGIYKESELGKVALKLVAENEVPDLADFTDWQAYEVNKEYVVSNPGASAEGKYCVYAANERNHTQSLSEASNIINVSKIAPFLTGINVYTIVLNERIDVLINNEYKNETKILADGSYRTYNMTIDDVLSNDVELELYVVELDPDDPEGENIIPVTKSDNSYTFRIGNKDLGNYAVQAITHYHGTKRETLSEAFTVNMTNNPSDI